MADDKKTTKTDAQTDAPGNTEVQSKMDVAVEQGFYGVEVDQTPNEHYTVAGVTAGKPTPETDAEAKANATK